MIKNISMLQKTTQRHGIYKLNTERKPSVFDDPAINACSLAAVTAANTDAYV